MGENDRLENEYFGDEQAWCNTDITETEVKFVLTKARLRKAVGINSIPYEVLKNFKDVYFARLFIHMLYQQYFTTDPRLPLQYRGIALLSTVYKLYTIS